MKSTKLLLDLTLDPSIIFTRASNSSRNSWTSNIEYLAKKYSNSSSIRIVPILIKTADFEPQIADFWPFYLEYWTFEYLLKPLKNDLWAQFTIVEIMYFCKNSVKPICIFVLFLFTPHFADSTRKFTFYTNL